MSDFRALPEDREAEAACLGAMMHDKETADVVSEILVARDFHQEKNQVLFEAIMGLYEKGEPVDVVTLLDKLKKMKKIDLIGGLSGLKIMLETETLPTRATYYADIVKEKSMARKLIKASMEITADAYDETKPVKEVMDMAEFRIMEATDQKASTDFVQIKDIIGDVYEEVYEVIGAENHVTGLPMGLSKIDALTRGLQPAKLYIIGARPGVGKTALAVNIAWNVASGKNDPRGIKHPVGIFSIEMTKKEITERLLCAVAGVDYNAAKENRILVKDRNALKIASTRIYDAPIIINDNSSLTIMELKGAARRLKKNYDIKLLVVDYLQLIRPGIHKDNREQEISHISMNLKALTKDLNIPIIVASQLSRPMKGTEGKPPTLSDLRESGAIEQDANAVIFIHKWKTKEDGWKHQLMLSKNRSGPTDEEIPIEFSAFSTTFYEVDRQEVRA